MKQILQKRKIFEAIHSADKDTLGETNIANRKTFETYCSADNYTLAETSVANRQYFCRWVCIREMNHDSKTRRIFKTTTCVDKYKFR